MQLSPKQKKFSQFLFAFSKFTLNFNISKKKMTLIADVFRKLRTPKNMVRYMCKKTRFRRPVDGKHGELAQTLLKSE